MMPSKISEIKKPNIPGENMLIVIIIQDKKSKNPADFRIFSLISYCYTEVNPDNIQLGGELRTHEHENEQVPVFPYNPFVVERDLFRALKAIVLLSTDDELSELLQLPPYVMVPVSVELKV